MVSGCVRAGERRSAQSRVWFFPLQVVLLGDHKQLRPVVHNDLCKSLGLETSLFERYSHQALMLDTQYRMVRTERVSRKLPLHKLW